MSAHSEAPTTLLRGYRQVENFGSEDEYEDEEEVTYVTLDLGSVEPTLVPSASSYHLIGLDTPTPFLQLQGTILKGRHHRLLGTEMVFTEDKDAEKRTVRHVANTEQRILFKEVTLQPKSPTAQPTRKGTSNADNTFQSVVPLDEVQRIDRMTGKAAPVTRAPRTRGAGKKKAAGSEENVAKSSKGKERAVSESISPPSDTEIPMDTT